MLLPLAKTRRHEESDDKETNPVWAVILYFGRIRTQFAILEWAMLRWEQYSIRLVPTSRPASVATEVIVKRFALNAVGARAKLRIRLSVAGRTDGERNSSVTNPDIAHPVWIPTSCSGCGGSSRVLVSEFTYCVMTPICKCSSARHLARLRWKARIRCSRLDRWLHRESL